MKAQSQPAKKELRVDDMQIQITEKYQAYRDLADRCLINAQTIDKGDKRVFYLKPSSVFLEEPRVQSQFRNDFIRMASTPPGPEPLTLFADDLHRDLIEQIQDKSSPSVTKDELCNFFKKRQYKLQHRKYKMMQRWAHYALTSELVDKVSLKFSPTYSKLQFELENSVKRYQRLEGEDHFLNKLRGNEKEKTSSDMTFNTDKSLPLSTLRQDDIDVYLRIISYEEKITKDAEKFIHQTKWVPVTQRYEIFKESIDYFQQLRQENIEKQNGQLEAIQSKGKYLIGYKKLGEEGRKDLDNIISCHNSTKLQKRQKSIKDKYLFTCKYNYDLPKNLIWNEVELKLSLSLKALKFGIQGDCDIDSGHSFAYNIMVFFPSYFQSQVIKSQFALYDAVPSMIDPTTLAKKDIKNVLDRNKQRYAKKAITQNTLLEQFEIKKRMIETGTVYINSIEKALFGEYNSGQIKDFPTVRLKRSHWIASICFQPQIDKDQQYQAAILAGDNNQIDECLRMTLDLVNVQDVTNANLMLESLANIHFDKIKYGFIKSEYLLQNAFVSNMDLKIDAEHVFTEGERSFFSVFLGCLRSKYEYTKQQQKEVDELDSPRKSLMDVPQHLVFSHYLVSCLKARDAKIKLLYTLNVFRSIQKRIACDMREMGTRERVMGDVTTLGPMEDFRSENLNMEELGENLAKSQIEEANDRLKPFTETSYSAYFSPKTFLDQTQKPSKISLPKKKNGKFSGFDEPAEEIDVLNTQLIDINKIRFNDRIKNYIHSTCPIVPKFHQTYGEPLERQEISAEMEILKKSENTKIESKKLFGRVDEITFNEKIGVYLVKDDYSVHVMYDSALVDMHSIEQEVLKICSFYINKAEPILDCDLSNIFPTVDRLTIIEEVFEWELQFQNAKAELVLSYLECYEHISDSLEQLRMIQMIVDLMAKRPRLNLNGTYFADSYRAEVDNLKVQSDTVREVIRMQMINELDQNNSLREYLEKTYRLIMDQIENKFVYQKPETLDSEFKTRENLQKGLTEDENVGAPDIPDTQSVSGAGESSSSAKKGFPQEDKTKTFSAKFSDPKEFANYLGVPFASLQMLMKDYKERDPVVFQTIHEHVSFIKIEEGYPIFIFDSGNRKLNNTITFTKQGERIGILDFYESLHVMVKVIAAMKGAFSELNDIHRPDNGLMTTSLELSTYRFLQAELKKVQGVSDEYLDSTKGLRYLEDDSIVGNPDRMLFYSKEFLASAEDEASSHNPYVLTKLNLKTIENFNFENIQKAMKEEQNLAVKSKSKITTHHAYRFFPKLKARAQRVFIPSLLLLNCNSIEVMRLRHVLSMAILQTKILEGVFDKQSALLGKDSKAFFKECFNLETLITLDQGYINFVDEGPATGLDIDLAINDFDPTLKSHLNFTDPDAFKSMICPTGLEELRCVVFYQLANLQTLIVATKTNQALLDNSMRYLAELELFAKGYVVANPVFDYYLKLSGSNLLEANLKKLASSEKSIVVTSIRSHIGSIYYNVIARKNRSRALIEKTYAKNRTEIVGKYSQKSEILLRCLRTYRMQLCQDYCYDILSEVYSDSIRLQLLLECDQIRKRAYLMPRDTMVIKLSPSTYGEYQSVNNREELPPQAEESEEQQLPSFKFFDKKQHHINNFLQLPSNKEIMKLKINIEKVREKHLGHLFQFSCDRSSGIEIMKPNVKKNSQHKTIKFNLPKYKLLPMTQIDLKSSKKMRLVDFKGSLNYQTQTILPYLIYFKSLANIFDLEYFQNKIVSESFVVASAESFVISGLPFWEEGDEALFGDDNLVSRSQDLSSSDTGKNKVVFKNIGQMNELTNRIVERMNQEKKKKLNLFQELESVKERFNEIGTMMKKLDLDNDIAQAAVFLQDHYKITFYGVLFSLTQIQDKYLKEGSGQKEISFLNEVIGKLSHQDDLKITYTNGFNVNPAVTSVQFVNLDEHNLNLDYSTHLRCIQPVIDETAFSPPQVGLIEGIYCQNSLNLKTFKKAKCYMGKTFGRDYDFLDFSVINLSREARKQAYAYLSSYDSTLKEYIKSKMGFDNTMSFTINQYQDIMGEKLRFLKVNLKARQMKRVVAIILNKAPIPADLAEYSKYIQIFNEKVQWKINSKWDDIQINKLAKQSAIESKQIVSAIKRQQQQSQSSSIQQLELATCEADVLEQEIKRFLLKSSFKLLEQETAALAKAFEMNVKNQSFYIQPCQQYASTRNQEIDKRSHLDTINKVSFAQKFLTQIKNRCLEVETITSGVGMVISKKDLNDVLEEACRSLIKSGEIEMRTRCEQYALQAVTFENLLYVKDQQLLSMEAKLKHAKTEIDKIIRTKVFAKGNQMIFELDTSQRQLGLIKHNIFTLEKKLTDEIRMEFDKELNQTRMELQETRRKFQDFQVSINNKVTADVRDNINNIDSLMKNKAELFKDLSRTTGGSTTINIGSITIKQVSGANRKTSDVDQEKDSSFDQMKIVREYDRLKECEKEAREEIIMLHEYLRKMRLFFRTKEICLRQKFENKIDNLNQQLSSNRTLWDQLGEAEKRETILKQELERSQKEIVTQEKIIEQMKDKLKLEQTEKSKLVAYKLSKSKRLEELESKAREFEVLHNLSLPKMLNMLEVKEEKIQTLQTRDKLNEVQMNQMQKMKEFELKAIQKKLEAEAKVKGDAIGKLEQMRHEMQLIEGQDQTSIDLWKDKCKKLIDICKAFKNENEELQLHLANSQNETLSSHARHSMVYGGSVEKQSRQENETKYGAKVESGASSRFKLKTDVQYLPYGHPAAILHDQQQITMNHSFEVPTSNSQMNNSLVLGGNMALERSNQSFVEIEQKSMSLPKIPQRGINISQGPSRQQPQQQYNIFSGKVRGDSNVTPPRSPKKIVEENASYASSTYGGKLTPVYDPSRKYMGGSGSQKKNFYSQQKQANVFSTLQKTVHAPNQEEFSYDQYMSSQQQLATASNLKTQMEISRNTNPLGANNSINVTNATIGQDSPLRSVFGIVGMESAGTVGNSNDRKDSSLKGIK